MRSGLLLVPLSGLQISLFFEKFALAHRLSPFRQALNSNAGPKERRPLGTNAEFPLTKLGRTPKLIFSRASTSIKMPTTALPPPGATSAPLLNDNARHADHMAYRASPDWVIMGLLRPGNGILIRHWMARPCKANPVAVNIDLHIHFAAVIMQID